MTSDQLVRRVFLGLTAAFIVFIVAASWTPGSDMNDGRRNFRGITEPSEFFRAHNVRDIATNVLLYIPLGVFLALALRRPRIISAWLLAGFAVSVTMEAGQMFVGRYPAVIDIITNSFGFVVGYGLIAVAIRFYGLDAHALLGMTESEERDTKTRSLAALRFVYISIYVLIAILPFDVSVSLTEVYGQLFAGDGGNPKIILNPLYSLSHWDDRGLRLVLEFIGLVPVALLTAFLGATRRNLDVFSPVLATTTLAALCELLQIFLLSRTSDIVMIPVAVLAGLAGWLSIRGWFSMQDVDAKHERVDARWRPALTALIGYAVVLLLLAWAPFRFETDPVTVAKKILHESNLLPFKEHFSTRSLLSAVDIVKEFGLFIPFGLLAAFLATEIRWQLPRERIIVVSALAAALFATFTELSQAVSIGRYIDVTDIFLAGAGGFAGAVLLRLFRIRAPRT